MAMNAARRRGDGALQILLSVGLMTGCAASGQLCSYDFRQQGFLGAAASVVTDEYNRCTEHLQAQLEDLQVQTQQAQRDAARLDELAKSTSGEQRDAARRLAELNRQSKVAADALNKARASQKVDQARLSDLIRQQQELQRQKSELTKQALQGDARDLKAEINALQRQQDALRRSIEAIQN